MNTGTGGGNVGGGSVGGGSVGGLFGRRTSGRFLGKKLGTSKMRFAGLFGRNLGNNKTRSARVLARNFENDGSQLRAIITGIAKIPGTSTMEFNATLPDPASVGGYGLSSVLFLQLSESTNYIKQNKKASVLV